MASLTPAALREFLIKRDTWKAYEKGCADFNVEIFSLLSQACTATRACKDGSFQKMDDAAELSTAVGFLQTICSDAVRPRAEALKVPVPNFPK